MAGDGKTDFYAEIGIKLNESQAKKEAAKGAKITADSIESAMIKAVQDVQAKQRKALSSIMPRRQGFSLKESLKSGGSYMSSMKGKSFSAQEYMKEREVWQKIIDKNDAALEKELQRAFKEEEKKNKQKALQEKAFQREQEKTLKEEMKRENLLEKENEKRISKRIKEDEAERKRINKKDEADRKAKEKAEKASQREKERRQKQEERLKEKAYRKDIDRIKSLGKWALGTTLAGGYLAQRVMNQSAERAFSFRNVQDIGVDYKTLRKWQAASKVFGNIQEEESAQSLVNLRNYRARMAQFGEAASLHANKLLGIDWSQKDERKLINDISNAILRQNKDIQGVLAEEVFGSQKYLSVLKRFQENPQEVWDVEKKILGGSLTEKQIKDVDELGQSFRFTALQAENFKDQIVAIASTDLKKWIKDVGNSLDELTPNLKSIWSGIKTTAKILGAPAEAIYKAGEWATGFMTEAIQSDLYNESKWKTQDRFDSEMKRRAQIETAQFPSNKTGNTENNKNITVNVGGVTVNKNQDIQETVKQAVWGAASAFEKETTNMFVELPTLGR